ncbi:MAG: hypothetical protein H3C35_08545 [Bacteroidetes bacterium]|nr:hypothetical protein [Bacteroidota bacterium]
MSETKKYTIGGKEFELKPLSLLQRRLAKSVRDKIIEGQQKLARQEAERQRAEKNNDEIKSLEVAVDMLSTGMEIVSIESEGDEFPQFLATILTPVGEVWKKENIELYCETMLEIDEVTQSEVLQSFLFKQSGSKINSPL